MATHAYSMRSKISGLPMAAHLISAAAKRGLLTGAAASCPTPMSGR
jgi:hypothetical protein